MATQYFELEQKVEPQHLDHLEHVNNVVYLQWVQDVAAAHWNKNASKEIKKGCVWVALRHEIDYKNQAFLDEELILRTWVEKFEGVKSFRRVQIIRKKDQKILVESLSIWCMLDAATGRPKRVSEEIVSGFCS